MKAILFSFLISLIAVIPCMAQGSAKVIEKGTYTWSSGQPGPLPVYVNFYSSEPSNILDSTAVNRAVSSALELNNLAPDVTVSSMSSPASKNRLYLYLDVSIYAGGEMRYEADIIDKNGESLGYISKNKSVLGDRLGAALFLVRLAHQSISDVKQRYDIKTPYTATHKK